MDQSLNGIDFQEGAVLLFDKPLDWTSFDLVNKVRWLLCKKLHIKKLKVGHAGTLDPKATGLVIVCTGKATKTIDSLQAEEKEYIATLKLGATTPSYDLEKEEDKTYPTEHITLELVQEKLKTFTGEIDQVPPIFSAIKVDGKRAFEFARKGNDPLLDARKITIYSIEVVRFEMPELVLRINCSKGTYIRSLARDLGESLGSGAYLTGLIRTKSGAKMLENAFTIEKFEKSLALI
ncbi:MAG TPA: tRNA pseudouridine(55) synthase TruB [Prolixibacteraceae bacterium]|nr:tRNA pseudouridine(55) synthase TruB [Prolixibacteraceae bacterium]